MTPDNRALWELVEKWRKDAEEYAYYGADLEDVAHRRTYRSCADELAAILERPVVVSGWLPIESAPRDGTKILAISGRYGVRETYWRFYGEGSPAKAEFDRGEGPSGAWDWSEPMSHWASSWAPAYWMPLPAAPETNESMVRGKS